MKVYTIDTGGGSSVDTLCYLATRELAEATLKAWREENDVHDDGWDIEEREVYERVPAHTITFRQSLEYTTTKRIFVRAQSYGRITDVRDEPSSWHIGQVQREIWFEWQDNIPKRYVSGWTYTYKGDVMHSDYSRLVVHLAGFRLKQSLEETAKAVQARVEKLVANPRSDFRLIPEHINREFK